MSDVSDRGASLSRREREIMDVLYARGQATAGEVQEQLAEPPGYSAVRKLLTILEEKGFVTHESRGKQYVYVPVEEKEAVAQGALRRVLNVFFKGSLEGAVTTMLSNSERNVSDEELERIEKLIQEARKRQK